MAKSSRHTKHGPDLSFRNHRPRKELAIMAKPSSVLYADHNLKQGNPTEDSPFITYSLANHNSKLTPSFLGITIISLVAIACMAQPALAKNGIPNEADLKMLRLSYNPFFLINPPTYDFFVQTTKTACVDAKKLEQQTGLTAYQQEKTNNIADIHCLKSQDATDVNYKDKASKALSALNITGEEVMLSSLTDVDSKIYHLTNPDLLSKSLTNPQVRSERCKEVRLIPTHGAGVESNLKNGRLYSDTMKKIQDAYCKDTPYKSFVDELTAARDAHLLRQEL